MEFYCRPWSQSNNNTDPADLEHRRDYERPQLTWTVQEYLPDLDKQNGQVIMENPSRSSIWKLTDIRLAGDILHREMFDNVADQCAHGAWSQDLQLPIRKRTFFRSTSRLRGTSRACK
eukprot:8426248-Pyramimonas_sp.AAC.1